MHITLLIIALLMSSLVFAQTNQTAKQPTEQSITQAHIKQKLLQMGYPQATVQTTPLKNLYQVVNDNLVFYMDETGRFIFSGTFVDGVTGIDLTEETLKKIRVGLFKELEPNFISYGKKDLPHRAVVFTDIDCGYCRHFHKNMNAINRMGIRIDYVLVPFRGEMSYQKSIATWCAKDRQQTLDKAKGGQQITMAKCLSPIGDNLEYAKKLQVRGTPAIYLPDGTAVGGYMQPQQLYEKILANRK